ncbi:ribonuclease P protein subunit p38-like [Ptychodera flava]|uniref:ribonuclease P protein subunit p38-like n=1 Tax=Ptychodera flava TaxID=63121 RepID=UPI00396A5260
MSNNKTTGKFGVKNSLDSPYKISWPKLQSGDTAVLLKEIQRVFQPLESMLKKKKPVKKKKKKLEQAEKKDPESEKKAEYSKLRSQLLFGINEVTKGLERSQLRLVMVCRSAKPELLITHLIPLCVSRQTPGICLSSLSNTLAPILGFTSLLAIGFKQVEDEDKSVFGSLVDLVIEKAPSLTVPWLKHQEVLAQKLEAIKDAAKRKHSLGDKTEAPVVAAENEINKNDVSDENRTEPDETGLNQFELDKSSGNHSTASEQDINLSNLDTTGDIEPPAKRRKVETKKTKKKKRKKQTGDDGTGLNQSELDKSSGDFSSTVPKADFIPLNLDTTSDLDKTVDFEPPAKRQKIEQTTNEMKKKKKKKKKLVKVKTKFQEHIVKQMKKIPNEKRQRRKKRKGARKK